MCFAVKANSNLSIIRLLGKLGAGFDIVSEGELRRIQAAGCDTSKVIFSGVAKTYHEIEAALDADIKCFNIESPAELDRVIAVAQKKGKKARVSFRVNPDVDAKTHPYISLICCPIRERYESFGLGGRYRGPLIPQPVKRRHGKNKMRERFSIIGQQINEMTGEDTVGAAPADAAQKAQDEALPAEGTDKNPEDATEQLPDSVTSPLRSAPNNPMSTAY